MFRSVRLSDLLENAIRLRKRLDKLARRAQRNESARIVRKGRNKRRLAAEQRKIAGNMRLYFPLPKAHNPIISPASPLACFPFRPFEHRAGFLIFEPLWGPGCGIQHRSWKGATSGDGGNRNGSRRVLSG